MLWFWQSLWVYVRSWLWRLLGWEVWVGSIGLYLNCIWILWRFWIVLWWGHKIYSFLLLFYRDLCYSLLYIITIILTTKIANLIDTFWRFSFLILYVNQIKDFYYFFYKRECLVLGAPKIRTISSYPYSSLRDSFFNLNPKSSKMMVWKSSTQIGRKGLVHTNYKYPNKNPSKGSVLQLCKYAGIMNIVRINTSVKSAIPGGRVQAPKMHWLRNFCLGWAEWK